jgi:hypothetical protein
VWLVYGIHLAQQREDLVWVPTDIVAQDILGHIYHLGSRRYLVDLIGPQVHQHQASVSIHLIE